MVGMVLYCTIQRKEKSVDRIPMDDDRISGSGCQPAKPEKVLRDDKKQKTHSSSVKAY